MENLFSVYQVRSFNYTSKEHYSDSVYSSKEKAIAALFEYCDRVSSQNCIEDLDGKLLTYPHCEDIYNYISRDKPAIYYYSKYGNYKMVVYVQELFVC